MLQLWNNYPMQLLVRRVVLKILITWALGISSSAYGANFVISLEVYRQFKSDHPELLNFYVLGSYSGLISANIWATPKMFCLPDRVSPSSLDPFFIIESAIDAHVEEFPTASAADLLMFELFRQYPCE